MTGTLPSRLAAAGRELHALGLSPGTSGNLSVRDGDGLLVTPTGAGLGTLTPDAVSRLDADGRLLTGPPPTKEVPLHLALYRRLPAARAVVHLHSTHAVAISCCTPQPPRTTDDILPALTPYFRMRVGTVPLCPYGPPGTEALAASVAAVPERTRAVLLAHHGPAATGTTLDEAVAAAVEVEEAAKLHLLLAGHPVRLLPAETDGASPEAEVPPEGTVRPAGC